jgi:hypothetical protein
MRKLNSFLPAAGLGDHFKFRFASKSKAIDYLLSTQLPDEPEFNRQLSGCLSY